MTNRIRLSWQRHLTGYEVTKFQPALVEWDQLKPSSWEVKPQLNLPAPMPELLGEFGVSLLHGTGRQFDPFDILYSVGKKTVKFDPIKSTPNLYLAFANTPRTNDGVIRFATKFGFLEHKNGFEVVDNWYRHIKRMNSAISKWENVRKDDPAAFAKTYRRLCPISDNSIKYFLQEGPSSNLGIYFEPESLLVAMWFQFACAVEGATAFGPCQECRIWIDSVPGSNRPDKIYCSDACRMRAYRKRKVNS